MIFLCKLEELSGDPSTKNVLLGDGEDELDIVVVQTNGARRAYINCCPHQFIPLETFPNHFLTEDKKYFVCSGHGARFQLDTGKCIAGPCLGKGLDPLSTIEQDGVLYLNESRTPAEIARAKLNSRRW